MSVVRSLLLFALAALAEIGGAWMVWQGIREHRGIAWIGAGITALAAYGFVATLQDDPNFGRILAAYGGVFVAGSLAWGMLLDGFKPDRYDLTGALICLLGVAVIMYAPAPPEAGRLPTHSSRRDPRARDLHRVGWMSPAPRQPVNAARSTSRCRWPELSRCGSLPRMA